MAKKTRRNPRGAGRPQTTRSKSTPSVSYRVSAEQWSELVAEAARAGITPHAAAKRARFPG